MKMSEEQQIEEIVQVLYNYEDALSDGYEYYATDVNEVLKSIAKEILEMLE